MNATFKAFLDRLEFEALDATVRFYDGRASAERVHIARQRLRHVRKIASSAELAQRELFAFRRSPRLAVAGH
jgi:hypothetical protein